MSEPLLPISATEQEQALSSTLAQRLDDLPLEIKTLWHVDYCSLPLLPILAWSLSCDTWSEDWTEAQQRSVCRYSTSQHAMKGSRQAVEQAIEQVGAGISIKEWWEQTPKGEPHTFTVTVAGSASAVSSIAYQQQLHRLIASTKPLRSHYTLNMGIGAAATVLLQPALSTAILARGTF